MGLTLKKTEEKKSRSIGDMGHLVFFRIHKRKVPNKNVKRGTPQTSHIARGDKNEAHEWRRWRNIDEVRRS